MFFKKDAGDGGGVRAPLEAVRQKLRSLQQTAPAAEVGGDGTVANDGPIPADKKAQIVRDEALVATALKLVGVDYASLITSDVGPNGEKSPYAMAVAADGAVLKAVLAADNPVLAALEVAVKYKPYAEFGAKYGNEPAAIRDAIAKEVKGPVKPESKAKGSLFSGTYGQARTDAKAGTGDLKSVFGK